MNKQSVVLCLMMALCCMIAMPSAQAATHKVAVIAGAAPLVNCPVSVSVPVDETHQKALLDQSFKLVDDGTEIPCDLIMGKEGLELVFIADGIDAYQTKNYELVQGEVGSKNAVSIDKQSTKLDISIGGKPFTTFHQKVNDKIYRPIFYPLYGPEGARMTRSYPIVEADPGEMIDHVHHHSLYVAHGEVNGVNFWHSGEGHGYQKVRDLDVTDGPVCARIDALIDWTDKDGETVFQEERQMTIWGTPDSARYIDFDLTFNATEGDVVFGDTKEGGLISFRVSKNLRVDGNKKIKNDTTGGGRLTNMEGLTNVNAWGKPSPWCDYSGKPDGISSGITIFDSPLNHTFPSRYHARDYGLFTINPFGLGHFADKSLRGMEHTLKKGDSWRFRYRIYIHAGDVQSGNVMQAYTYYSATPRVILH